MKFGGYWIKDSKVINVQIPGLNRFKTGLHKRFKVSSFATLETYIHTFRHNFSCRLDVSLRGTLSILKATIELFPLTSLSILYHPLRFCFLFLFYVSDRKDQTNRAGSKRKCSYPFLGH